VEKIWRAPAIEQAALGVDAGEIGREHSEAVRILSAQLGGEVFIVGPMGFAPPLARR
jgi:hypothetical protein